MTKEFLAIGALNGLKMYIETLNRQSSQSRALTLNYVESALENRNKPILHRLSDLTE